MGCNLDMENPDTIEQLDKWGKWYQELTDVDGYRLDAVKHIRFDLFVDWLLHRREEKAKSYLLWGNIGLMSWISYRNILIHQEI